MIIAAEICKLPTTGVTTGVVIAGLLAVVFGVAMLRWVRQSLNRLSVVITPLLLLGGLALVPQEDSCIEATPASTSTTAAVTTTVASTSTTIAVTTTPTTATTLAPATTTTVAATTTTTVAATTTTTAAVTGYNVGDTGPGGGKIFYKDLTRAAGSQYFEAACVGWSDGTCGGTDLIDLEAQWGCYETLLDGADGTAIGTGRQNTADILAGCAEAGIAAKIADNLVLGGKTDWFLPSKDELNQMNIQKATVGGFTDDYWWSSSEIYATKSWQQYFDGANTQTADDKYYDDGYFVRPVRCF
jgi:hypothetical protein